MPKAGSKMAQEDGQPQVLTHTWPLYLKSKEIWEALFMFSEGSAFLSQWPKASLIQSKALWAEEPRIETAHSSRISQYLY